MSTEDYINHDNSDWKIKPRGSAKSIVPEMDRASSYLAGPAKGDAMKRMRALVGRWRAGAALVKQVPLSSESIRAIGEQLVECADELEAALASSSPACAPDAVKEALERIPYRDGGDIFGRGPWVRRDEMLAVLSATIFSPSRALCSHGVPCSEFCEKCEAQAGAEGAAPVAQRIRTITIPASPEPGQGREIIICENCHLSGYVGSNCSRCGHVIGKQASSSTGAGGLGRSEAGGSASPARLSDELPVNTAPAEAAPTQREVGEHDLPHSDSGHNPFWCGGDNGHV